MHWPCCLPLIRLTTTAYSHFPVIVGSSQNHSILLAKFCLRKCSTLVIQVPLSHSQGYVGPFLLLVPNLGDQESRTTPQAPQTHFRCQHTYLTVIQLLKIRHKQLERISYNSALVLGFT